MGPLFRIPSMSSDFAFTMFSIEPNWPMCAAERFVMTAMFGSAIWQ